MSRKGQSVRFTASDEALRPMGRATSGVTGMKFRADDELLAMDVVREDAFLFTVTEGGIAKRTALTVENYRQQGRGGLGIKVANLPGGERRPRRRARGRPRGRGARHHGARQDRALRDRRRCNATGRDTQGVIFAKPDNGRPDHRGRAQH